MTLHFNLFAFIDHFLNIFLSDTDDCFLNSLLRAVAIELCRHCICDLQIKSFKNLLEHLLRCMSVIQHGCYRLDLLNIRFQLIEYFIFDKRHNLYDKSAGAFYCIIFIHKNSKSYRRWYLFRCCEIISEIFRDLSCLQDCLSGVWLFESHVFDDRHDTLSKCSTNIKLSILRRKHNIRIKCISFHISFTVRCHCQTFDLTGTLNLDCQHICIILHHASHHHSACKKTSERCCRNRTCSVMLSCLLNQLRCHCRKCTDLCISCCCSYNIIIHVSFSSYFLCNINCIHLFPGFSGHDIDSLTLPGRCFMCHCIICRLKNKSGTFYQFLHFF